MDYIMLALVIAWLIAAFFVFRFVVWTGGSPIGRVGHFFGGTSVMLVIAFGLIWIYALASPHFAVRVNTYLMTHLVVRGDPGTIVRQNETAGQVTVFRHASVNFQATLENNVLNIDESKTVRTSLWRMLWDSE